jgi:hypothetical protein
MSERRFVLVDFTHMSRTGRLRLYEAGHTMPFHVPSRMLRQSANSSPNSGHRAGYIMFELTKVLTEAEVIEAEAELKALQRHALEVIDPETDS